MKNNYFGFVLIAVFVLGGFFAPNFAQADAVGPNNPATAVNDSSTGAGTISWSSIISPVVIDGASSASISLGTTTGTMSKYIKFSNFNFSIPSNVNINGITVNLVRRATQEDSIKDAVVELVTSGATTTSKADTTIFWPESFTSKQYGNNIDTWGRVWTATEINNSSFG